MSIKKISGFEPQKGFKKMAKENKQIKKSAKQLEQDKVELENHKKRLDSEIEHLEYTVREIQFFPEDLEKTKGMNREEKNEFMRQLRTEGRYTYVDEQPNQ